MKKGDDPSTTRRKRSIRRRVALATMIALVGYVVLVAAACAGWAQGYSTG